jgi:hypothetical protein
MDDMSRTLSGKTKAWITQHSTIGPKDLLDEKVIGALAYHSDDMSKYGWTLVGEAEITLHIADEKTLVDNKVAALREELKNVRAEAQAKATRLESQINDLLALTYTPAEQA